MAEKILNCSFCGKSTEEIRKLIAGPNVYICNECVDICLEILLEDGYKFRALKTPRKKQEVDLSTLGLRPRFTRVKFKVKKNHCFYLCPFSEPFNTIYRDHVVKAITSQ